MGLGVEATKQWVSVKDGKFVVKSNGIEEFYDFIEGRITDIKKTKRTINNYELDFIVIDIDDYSVSLGFNSGLALSILNALCSVEGSLGNIKIKVYSREGHNKAIVIHDNQKLNWKYRPDEIPIKSNTGRAMFMDGMIEEIKGKITNYEAF